VCGLLANPWLEHVECHPLLAAIAGVLVEVEQRSHNKQQQQQVMLPSRQSAVPGARYGEQLQQLLGAWGAPEMRR
jgi:uncharacterized protein (DUF1501 family)